ncbi:DUF302 domain-containing protein [Zobellia laminariae]|uniref:DUF302 domain-containing protein n=1 Tax=Zobellia laminariae TaxID=248906 RepID=UPI0012D9EEFD|nr:DUF302 domain-containing protein [Zobellia laminariae]
MNLKFLTVLFLTFAFVACDEDETTEPETIDTNPNVVGMNYVKSTQSFDDTYAVLKASLDTNENIKIVAEVDHAANAASVGLELNPTKIIFFGNPIFRYTVDASKSTSWFRFATTYCGLSK